VSAVASQCVSSSAAAAPARLSKALSMSDRRMRSDRPAPRATLMAVSRCLSVDRASSRPVRFVHVSSSTKPAIASKAPENPITGPRSTLPPRPGGERALVCGRILAAELCGDRIERRFGLGDGDVRTPSAQEKDFVRPAPFQPVVPRFDVCLHHHRHPDIRREKPFRAAEASRRDAKDGEGLPVYLDRATDDVGIGRESTLPEVVAQHHDRMSAWNQVVLCGQRPSQDGANAEQVEVVARREIHPDSSGCSTCFEAHRREAVGGDAREKRAAITEVAVVRVRMRGQPAADLVDSHELSWPLDRKRLQQSRIDHAEDRRVRTNPEAQGQHSHGGE